MLLSACHELLFFACSSPVLILLGRSFFPFGTAGRIPPLKRRKESISRRPIKRGQTEDGDLLFSFFSAVLSSCSVFSPLTTYLFPCSEAAGSLNGGGSCCKGRLVSSQVTNNLSSFLSSHSDFYGGIRRISLWGGIHCSLTRFLDRVGGYLNS